MATGQLLADGGLDYLVYDYLAEITMGILARARARDPGLGYATDFLTEAMAPNLVEIAARKLRVISNAGGVNPEALAGALRAEIARQGLGLRVACVTGDDLGPRAESLAEAGHRDMFTGAPFPPAARIGAINAYLGAFPIAAALDTGADIVITGRVVDSAPALGACIHAFGWGAQDHDLLAAGSLAGHLLECGTQATGGNFTDWKTVAGGIEEIGYPIAEIAADGALALTRPAGSGGIVSPASVGEQLLYEIGDPQDYRLPDVTCDFSQVTLRQDGADRVAVAGARGRAPGDRLKTCVIWQDGWRLGHIFGFYGLEAEEKAAAFAEAALGRARAMLKAEGLADFTGTDTEILGAESQFGAQRRQGPAREVMLKIAVRHEAAKGAALLLKAATGLALAAPPGLSGFAGTRPRPSPVMALFSFLLPKAQVTARIAGADGTQQPFAAPETAPPAPPPAAVPPPATPAPLPPGGGLRLPLIRLAVARSGDKGDDVNIGVIARHPTFLPHIWQALDEAHIRRVFGHLLEGEVRRHHLPGIAAMNIVLERALGGGGTSSLRADPQGKGHAQLLLASEIEVPAGLTGTGEG